MKRIGFRFRPAVAAALTACALTVAAAPARARQLTYVTSLCSSGSGAGQFSGPAGVAVSGGLVYVADNSHRVVRFDPANLAGTFTSFGHAGFGPGQFHMPDGVAVDGSGNVFVGDDRNDRLVKLATVPRPQLGRPGARMASRDSRGHHA
jgi:DNA-binding beta-propeller fold protein YncE